MLSVSVSYLCLAWHVYSQGVYFVFCFDTWDSMNLWTEMSCSVTGVMSMV